MLLRLIVLLTVVPIIELVLILKFHGLWNALYGGQTATMISVGTIIFTGILGAKLAKSQGMQVLQELNKNTSQGKMPDGELMEGVMILVGGGMLLTPGYLTDLVGLLLIIPPTRKLLKLSLQAWIKKQIQSGKFTMRGGFSQGGVVFQSFGGSRPSGFPGKSSSHTQHHSSRKIDEDVIDVEVIDSK